MDKINEKALSGLSIHALRVLGRDLGVKQPTSLKKEDLICEIMLIHNGEKAPYVPTNKKGRPPKSNEKTIKDFSFLPENDEKTLGESKLGLTSPGGITGEGSDWLFWSLSILSLYSAYVVPTNVCSGGSSSSLLNWTKHGSKHVIVFF